jgi:hypothetical protein
MTRTIVLLAMMALLGACKATPQQNLPVAQPAASTPAPTSVTLACPSSNFDGFLKAFISDIEVQKTFSAKPLESQTVDVLAEPEPALVTKMLSAAELQFPLIPSEQQQVKEGLTKRQSVVLENGHTKVTLAKEDTDYQMSFYFRKNQCWQLYRIRNESL